MAFTTLAERFEQRSKEIYGKFSPSSDQFVAIKPDTEGALGSRSRIKNDTRAVPVVSVIRDTKRVSSFLTSPEGVLFLGKQTLLQTANTFVTTKLYNPVSPLLNVVPFVHARRHLDTQALTGAPSGILQNTTVDTISSKFKISGQLAAVSSGRRSLLPALGSVAKSYIATKLKNAANAIVPLPQTYAGSRPEYKVFTSDTGPVVFDPQPLNQRGIPKLGVSANVKATIINSVRKAAVNGAIAALNRSLPRKIRNQVALPINTEPEKIPTFVDAAKAFRKNFYERTGLPAGSRVRSKYIIESTNALSDNENNSDVAKPTGYYPDTRSIKSTYQDKYNVEPFASQEPGTDIIKFIFSDIDNGTKVHFRALLSSIKENVKPEFAEQRYVGRTERFVTYSGAKRTVSLSFNIVAFSQIEADGMWSKVNYLTGLAFPKGVTNGFMIPPLFKMTIGGLYENQPCYIETLDYDFLDETITFDIDKEVPFAINVNMQISILEKRSKFYDSPFYKITENLPLTVNDRIAAADRNARRDLELTSRLRQANEEFLDEFVRPRNTLTNF